MLLIAVQAAGRSRRLFINNQTEMACSANKKLVVFIVDDEPGPLQTLANDLKEMPEVGEVCTFSSYSDAVYPAHHEAARRGFS